MSETKGQLRVSLFGMFNLVLNGQIITLPTRQAKSLFAFLTLHAKVHDREALADMFWGDSINDKAQNLLRTTLATLRKHLGDHMLLTDRKGVQINPKASLWVDVHEFDVLTNQPASVERLERAVALYRDDLLVDLREDWISDHREEYLQRYIATLLQLAQEMRARSEYERAIGFAGKALAHDSLNEKAHHHLMFCHVALGNRPAALRQHEMLLQTLRDVLKIEPSAETVALYDWIKHAPAQHKAHEAQITNLPIPLTSFIGRKHETAEVKRLLTPPTPIPSLGGRGEAGTRLVTLTGAGGSGKTRLAIQAATDLIDHFKDGVWWVELAPLVSETLVPQTVAKALGVQEMPDQALTLTQTIANHLRDKHALLILDNCEHVLATCARLAQGLLQACPDVRILVTSREPLGMLGETVWPVPALSLPDSHKLSLVKALLEYEAFRLFVERAQAANAAFALTDAQALVVAQICRRLDGIPLAIELAAARVRSMTVGQIAANLDDRFNLLTAGNRSALPRHQTLRATIDWSYALLSEPERILFRQLSVFVGGWTLEAAQAVISQFEMKSQGLETDHASSSFLNSHSRLVDKSLVLAEQHNGDMRYRMLETIREYAAEKLVESGEQVRIRDIHLDFFTRFAEYQWHELTDSSKQFWWERFDVEGNNFRAALDWALMHPDERGLKLTAALGLFWYGTSSWTDERDRHIVQRFLDHTTATQPSTTRARSLQMAALLATNEDDPITALPLADESIAIARALGEGGKSLLGLSLFVRCWANLMRDLPAAFDAARESIEASRESDDDVALGLALMIAGVVQRELGDYTAAREAYESSLATFRKIDNEWMSANPQTFLGQWYSIHGDTMRALEFLEPAVKIHQEMKNRRMIGETVNILGDVAELERNFELAVQYYEDSLTVFRELGSQQRIANALSNLGRIAWRNGDVEQAKVVYREGLPKFIDQPDKTMIAYATGHFACFLSSQGDLKSAAHLLGAVYAHFEVMGARIRPLVQAEFDRYLEVTRKTLGEENFAAAYGEGRVMSLDQAIMHGLEKI